MPNATLTTAAVSAQNTPAQTPNVATHSLKRTQSGHEQARDETRQGFENQEDRGGGEADAHYVDHAYMHKVRLSCLPQSELPPECAIGSIGAAQRPK